MLGTHSMSGNVYTQLGFFGRLSIVSWPQNKDKVGAERTVVWTPLRPIVG